MQSTVSQLRSHGDIFYRPPPHLAYLRFSSSLLHSPPFLCAENPFAHNDWHTELIAYTLFWIWCHFPQKKWFIFSEQNTMKILVFWIFQSWILKAKINNGSLRLTLKSQKRDIYSETDIFKKYLILDFDSSLVFGKFFWGKKSQILKVVYGVKYYSSTKYASSQTHVRDRSILRS